jgi:hypothetical protein
MTRIVHSFLQSKTVLTEFPLVLSIFERFSMTLTISAIRCYSDMWLKKYSEIGISTTKTVPLPWEAADLVGSLRRLIVFLTQLQFSPFRSLQ